MQQEQQGGLPKRTYDFQDILKHERAQHGWSQADVAEKIGSDPKTVGRWERGLTFPSPYMSQQLSKLYGKSIQELHLIRDDPPSSVVTKNTQKFQAIADTPVSSPISTPPKTTPIISIRHWSHRRIIFSLSLLIIILLLLTIIFRWPQSHSTPSTAHSKPLSNPYASTGTLVLHDALNADSANGWSLSQNEQGQCFFANGTYRIRDVQSGYMEVCLANESYFTNFTYEVQMTIQAGDCGGLAFRSTFPQLYYFLSCLDGRYRLVRYDKDNQSNRRIIAIGVSPVIHKGLKATNTLAVVAVNNTFEIYVNHTRIITGTDSAYFDGQVGLIAHTCRMVYADARPNLCDTPTEVSFSNARVWNMT